MVFSHTREGGKMINAKRTKQNWTIGSTVKVGFMSLEVIDTLAVKDGLPDLYLMRKGNVYYEFIPHNGLSRLNASELANIWKRVS